MLNLCKTLRKYLFRHVKGKSMTNFYIRRVHVWILRSIWPSNLTLNKTSYNFFFTIEQFFFENNCMPINSFNNFSTFICSKLHSLRVYQNGSLWTKNLSKANIDRKQSTTEQLFYLSRNLWNLISTSIIAVATVGSFGSPYSIVGDAD